MRKTRLALAFGLLAALCMGAAAADDELPSATVVHRDGRTVELTSFQLKIEDAGLFGTSLRALKRLPVEADGLRLDVPLENLRRIEVLSVDEEEKDVRLRLTAADGKVLEAALATKKKIIWTGKHAFANAEATLDLASVKEIVLRHGNE